MVCKNNMYTVLIFLQVFLKTLGYFLSPIYTLSFTINASELKRKNQIDQNIKQEELNNAMKEKQEVKLAKNTKKTQLQISKKVKK